MLATRRELRLPDGFCVFAFVLFTFFSRTSKKLQRTKCNAVHFDKDGQQRLIETIALGWYGVLWGRLEEMVDLKKKGKTIPPLKLSALHMIEENDSLDWSIDWALREGGGKRKAADSEPTPSKSSRR